ncbi:hypothetical protein D5O23_24885 [Salmonella enterica subsp. enterica]|uniref:hypothetical protein n=1 Tax=Salmonella enterica TaxID=28901 RepID=UPI0003BDA5C4|nr:hypothetical protein [Salmonella enterica]EAB5741461.1 hypothetical protein [Salmonella enterica subsp. enterica serovar Mokola]EBR8053212.1 hypothetical protein [Salmonella enterica subsp. enterica serovar Altona]EBU9962269.1 hypothetical protein [Salmonella enterica subsp. enterica serovar Onireke]EBV0502987.1 hypothetical protein [Salmonella enterica subsp. enterica serovar Teddington]ECI4031526.1 hypothetical protein [Salmonella enterica subsp. enterica]
MINFIIGLSGIDPKTGQEIWLAKIAKKNEADYSIDYLTLLIDKVLDEAVKFGGEKGLEGLRNYHVQLLVGISSDEEDNVRPSFQLSQRIISRLCAAGASFDFDPYV